MIGVIDSRLKGWKGALKTLYQAHFFYSNPGFESKRPFWGAVFHHCSRKSGKRDLCLPHKMLLRPLSKKF
jgi:hypothetical protein